MNPALLPSGSREHMLAPKAVHSFREKELESAKDYKDFDRIEQRYRETLKRLRHRTYFPH